MSDAYRILETLEAIDARAHQNGGHDEEKGEYARQNRGDQCKVAHDGDSRLARVFIRVTQQKELLHLRVLGGTICEGTQKSSDRAQSQATVVKNKHIT